MVVINYYVVTCCTSSQWVTGITLQQHLNFDSHVTALKTM